MSGFSGLRAVLSVRAFRRLWAVLGLSSLGDWLGLLATSTFAADQVSGSAAKGAAFGGVIAVRMLPALVLGPVSGVIADRWDRRYTMVVCDLVRFVLFASIPTVALLTTDTRLVVGWAAVATFVIETAQMVWAPAKESSVPNLLPRAGLEAANQLTLATTYGFAPISAVAVLAVITWLFHQLPAHSTLNATHIALYFNAVTFLATAVVVYFGIREISGRAVERPAKKPGLLREFTTGWKYVAKTRLVRGLVLGIFGAFGAAGVVVGTSKFYAESLGGGDLAFYILFGCIFLGLSIGIVAGPRMIGQLSRRRWFGLSIIWAAVAVTILAFAWHLVIAVVGALCVGIGAGMAFLSGTTLLGKEVTDDVRGRVFAFIQTGTQVTLLLTISLSSFFVGLGGTRQIFGFTVSATRPLLLIAGAFGLFAGIGALRQMDDKPGVPLFADLLASWRGQPLPPIEVAPTVTEQPHGRGVFIVFEGGEGAGKSTQLNRLSDVLASYGRPVVVTREPGATPIGARIRAIVLADPSVEAEEPLTPRAEALLYAADRAHHVASVIRPALDRGDIVICDRFVDSSLAYQGSGRTLPPEDVRWLSRWATAGLRPDLVILLDVDPAVGLARAKSRAGQDRIEAESLAFHERVREAFRSIAVEDPARYLTIDATEEVDVIAFKIRERVHQLLPAGPSRRTAPVASDPMTAPITDAPLADGQAIAETAADDAAVDPPTSANGFSDASASSRVPGEPAPVSDPRVAGDDRAAGGGRDVSVERGSGAADATEARR